MSIGSDLAASVFAEGASAAFLVASLVAVADFLVASFEGSAFWARAEPAARPKAARATMSDCRILRIWAVPLVGVGVTRPLNGRPSVPVDAESNSPALAGLCRQIGRASCRARVEVRGS